MAEAVLRMGARFCGISFSVSVLPPSKNQGRSLSGANVCATHHGHGKTFRTRDGIMVQNTTVERAVETKSGRGDSRETRRNLLSVSSHRIVIIINGAQTVRSQDAPERNSDIPPRGKDLQAGDWLGRSRHIFYQPLIHPGGCF